MKEWRVELWEKILCKFVAHEGLAYSKALATATVVTDVISLTVCMKLQVTRQAIYVRRIIQGRLCNHCYSRKTVSIASRMCVFLALDTQPEMCTNHVVICVLPGTTIFFHITSQTPEFSGKVTEHKVCVLIFSTAFVRNISHSKKN